MNQGIFKSSDFLALWDDPPDHCRITFNRQDNVLNLVFTLEPPDCPTLEFPIPSMITGRA